MRELVKVNSALPACCLGDQDHGNSMRNGEVIHPHPKCARQANVSWWRPSLTPLWHKVAIYMLLHWRLFQGNRAIGEIVKSKKLWFLRKWLPKLHYDELAIGLLDFFHFSLNGCWQLHPHTSFIHYFNHNSHVSQFSFNSMKAFACFLFFLGRNSLFSHCIVTQNTLAMAFWLIIVMGCNHESYNRFLPKLHLNELLDQCIWS